MPFSMQDTFAVMAAHMPAEIATPADLATLFAIGHELPFALSRHVRLAVPLDADKGFSATAIKVAIPDGRDILAGANPAIQLSDRLLLDPTWVLLRDFCQNWADPSGVFQRYIESLWVAFETANSSTSCPAPKFFFFLNEWDTVLSRSDGAEAGWLISTALQLLNGGLLPASVVSQIAACFDAAREHAQFLQIGLLPDQKPYRVQLGLFPHSQEDLLAYLDNIGWAGQRIRIAEFVAPLYSLGAEVCLNVSLGEEVEQQIDIECYFNGVTPSQRYTRYSLLLNHLVEQSLCTSEKQSALLTFPGYSVANMLYKQVFFRDVYQIEVSYRTEQPATARAYLGCTRKPFAHLKSAS